MNTKKEHTQWNSTERRFSPSSPTSWQTWSRRGERYAIAILERGGSPSTILQSLGIAPRVAETSFAAVSTMFDNPIETAARASAEREFRQGAVRVAMHAGALAAVDDRAQHERARA